MIPWIIGLSGFGIVGYFWSKANSAKASQRMAMQLVENELDSKAFNSPAFQEQLSIARDQKNHAPRTNDIGVASLDGRNRIFVLRSKSLPNGIFIDKDKFRKEATHPVMIFGDRGTAISL